MSSFQKLGLLFLLQIVMGVPYQRLQKVEKPAKPGNSAGMTETATQGSAGCGTIPSFLLMPTLPTIHL
jgi:hypothetical protein